MKPVNIISAYNSGMLEIGKKELTKGFELSVHESGTLSRFVDLLKKQDARSICFSGYYVGYSIKQISKEFDLLRFSEELVINIELKGPLDEERKLEKISRQMNQNYYYLKSLGKRVLLYTYIEDDGLYTLNYESNEVRKTDISKLVKELKDQTVDYKINPDNLFVPKNYLISVFNNPQRFLNGEYFLTDHQQEIKKEILDNIKKGIYKTYCIPANAGTGKTLLAYDIARHMIRCNDSLLIIHCGKLNGGQSELNSSGFRIIPIRTINKYFIDSLDYTNIKIIIVDESQRISSYQLDLIIDKSFELKIPIVFMYDTKQYLKTGETKEIYDYIKGYNESIPLLKKRLKNKIRTNKEMASFIQNLGDIGSSNSYLNYEDITIEYFNELEDVEEYIKDLEKYNEWKAITYTTSIHNIEPLDNIADVCNANAHDVIGQEFDKVVFVMDSNFKYNGEGKLTTRQTYYSAGGMLYQIVTRVVEELKIIVLNNPNLFIKLLEIKHSSLSVANNKNKPEIL